MKNILFIISITIISLFFTCSDNPTVNEDINHPPQITSLVSEHDTIGTGTTSVLTCNATDSDGDNLSFVWSTDAGAINGSGSSVNWVSPNTVGIYYVKCRVLDGKGGEDVDSVNIVVEQQLPTQGLVAYYPFNGNANDESGNGKNGTIYGISVQFVPGIFDQAIKFDNSNSGTFTVNDYVELPNISINELSVSHWVKYLSGSSTSFDGCTYSIGVFPSKQFFIRITNTGQIRGYIVINSSSYATDLIDLSDKQWHLVTVTVDSDYMRIYMDGSIVDSTGLPSIPDFTDAYQYIALFRFNNDRSSRFTGELDDLYIFNRALSDAEVLQLYNK